jgi:quercetin dioxygenase-like cupin family protein
MAVAVGEQLSAAHYVLEPSAVVPEHVHDNEEYGQVLHGSLRLRHGGHEVLLGAGQGFLIPGGELHAATAGDDGCELLECYAPPRVPAAPKES